MLYLNGWHPFESIRFDLVKITMWRCLVLQIWEQENQLLRKQRVIQLQEFKDRSHTSLHSSTAQPLDAHFPMLSEAKGQVRNRFNCNQQV